MSRFSIGFVGGGGLSSAAGAALLATMPGWWDGLQYSGSGNWLNRGTVGATGDLVPGASTAAPTFTTDHFSFDGSNDFMATATHVASFDAPDKNNAFTVGVVCSWPSTPTNFGTLVNQIASASHPGWRMTNTSTNRSPSCEINDASSRSTATYGTPVGVSTKSLFLIGSTVGGNLFAQINNGTAGTVADARTASSTGTSVLSLGRSGDLTTFQHVDVHGLFITPTALTAQNYTDIGSYYGLTI